MDLQKTLKWKYSRNACSFNKKECFEKCGNFNENLHALEDWELFLRISKDYKFIFINEALVISYESPVSVSKTELII